MTSDGPRDVATDAKGPVGFVGLGRMGAGMAANLRRAGVDLHVHDTRNEAAAALVELGATAHPSPASVAAEVELVFLCLPFAPEVRVALFGAGGIAEGAAPGLLVVDTTTLHRSDAVAIGTEAAAVGLRYADCPVSGMPVRADDGTLTIMFGGDAADLAVAHPFLAAMGRDIVHCGALGTGQLMKAVNNIVYDVNIAALCEVLPLAVAAGLDVEQVAAVLTSGSSRSFASDYFVHRILDGRFDTDFSMGDAYKDIVNIQQVAADLHAATPVVNAMTATYQLAMALGWGDEPKSAMVKVYEQVLGVEARRPGPPG